MSLLKTIGDYLNQKYIHETEQMNQVMRVQQQQLIDNACCYTQLRLQEALFQVLKSITISSDLCSLKSSGDLFIFGYQIYYDSTHYYFAWTKNNYDIIAGSILSGFIKKINNAIRREKTWLFARLQQFDDNTRVKLIYENAILYNGFRVIECKDMGDVIILTVEIA